MYRPPSPPPCTGHHRHRHVQATVATAVYWPPPSPPCTGHHRHRHVLATVATAVYWPPPPPPPGPPSPPHVRPPPCTPPPPPPCMYRPPSATAVTAMYRPPPCTAHHRHRHVLATTATATRVPSPCHVSPPLPRASPRRHRRATCRSRFHVPRPAASPRHLSPPLPRAPPRRFPAPPVAKLAASLCYKAPRARGTTRRRRLRSFVAGMPPRRRGSSGFRGVRARPNGRFYAEMRAGGFRLTLGTYNTPELAARAYDAAAWRFRRPRCDMNFPDVESLEEAEFLAPTPCLVDDEDRRRHRQVQRRIAIAEHDEELMRQWRAQFPNDVDNTAAFFADLRAQRRSNRRHRRAVAVFELDNPNTTWADNDPRWDDIWTETTSDDE
ncbi:hypothetical protein QYE76_008731 [Lolium multiflorum]|uniref:AP2/ERF domain-containing protein n=1 Tax=Lolium multiflorum TaxID=4521 RepID=A0AAD8TTU5_LOLMU|nr:hypothetical protein QYE76_008731 [Lolium multiflorum]